VIVHIFIAQGQADDPLVDQRPERMHHPARIAPVTKARRDPVDQADRPVRLAEQQRSGIRGHRPAVERCLHPTAPKPFEFTLIGDTLCRHRTSLCDLIKSFLKNNFLRFSGPMHLLW
jgi:hypothetical protein